MSVTTEPWIQTHGGRRFDLLEPDPAQVHIDDLAHALSLTCRFGGHTREFYSVAQHSVLVSLRVPKHAALFGLLHDAAEAYIGDVPSPLKDVWPDVRVVEARIMVAICARFALPCGRPHEVHTADRRMLATEVRDLMAPTLLGWRAMPEPYSEPILSWGWGVARAKFVARFRALTEG